MPKYQFVAEGPNQESQKGVVEAPSHAAARQKLEQHGFRVLTIVPVESVESNKNLMPPQGKPPAGPMPGDLQLDPAPITLDPAPLDPPLEPTPLQPIDNLPAATAAPSPSQALPHVRVEQEHWRPLARGLDPWYFDVGFRKLAAPSAVSGLYGLTLFGAVLSFLYVTYMFGTTGFDAMRFSPDAMTTLKMLFHMGFFWLSSVLGIVIFVFLVRLFCEGMLVLFHVSDNLDAIRKQG